jgi:class 3 adenylate cyclase
VTTDKTGRRSIWTATTLGIVAILLLSFWIGGPHGTALDLWRMPETSANFKGEINYFPIPGLQLWAKMLLGFTEHDQNTKGKEDLAWVGALESPFNFAIAGDALLAVVLGFSLLVWRRQNEYAHQMATALSLFAFALAGFLLVGQDGLRFHFLAWPGVPRLLVDMAVTTAFVLTVIRVDRFFSVFPTRLEDWQVIRSILRWAGGPVPDEQKVRRWYQPGRSNLLNVVRRLPWAILVLQVAGNLLFSLPFMAFSIDWAPSQNGFHSLHDRAVLAAQAAGAFCWILSLILMAAFGWLFAVGLLGKLRAGREYCTEEERRQSDWLFASGAVTALMLAMLSAWLVAGMLYLAWGDSTWVRSFVLPASVFLIPAGWGVSLLALAGAVFLSKSFGPKPLLKRTLLVTAVGFLTSLVLAVVQHLVTTKLLRRSTPGMQQGLSAVLAGGIVAASLGFFRRKIEHNLDRVLNRFMPASVIADGKRRDLVVAFSDLGGYTALSATDEAQALHVAGHFQKVAVAVARQNSGRIVKTIGDAVMWVFATPAAAFTATLALSVEFKRAVQADQLPSLPVNSGVHYGSVVEAPGGDVYGAAVNLAARLQGAAKDGAVVASSEAVLEATGGFRFEPLGKLELKNVPTPIACFRVFAAA